MNKIDVCLAAVSVVFLVGCDSVTTVSRPDSYYNKYALAEEYKVQSLFSSDSAVLSDDDIERILAYKYAPERQNRIAILSLGQSDWCGWSAELATAGAEVRTQFVAKLRSSPVVFDASYLPSLLIPSNNTVGHFREAGARYQADLLLIYRAKYCTYAKDRFISPDKSKSYCTVEAVLLDTRTGIVPFTATASCDFVAQQDKEDLNFGETMRRTELHALADGLAEVAEKVVGFLGTSE